MEGRIWKEKGRRRRIGDSFLPQQLKSLQNYQLEHYLHNRLGITDSLNNLRINGHGSEEKRHMVYRLFILNISGVYILLKPVLEYS